MVLLQAKEHSWFGWDEAAGFSQLYMKIIQNSKKIHCRDFRNSDMSSLEIKISGVSMTFYPSGPSEVQRQSHALVERHTTSCCPKRTRSNWRPGQKWQAYDVVLSFPQKNECQLLQSNRNPGQVLNWFIWGLGFFTNQSSKNRKKVQTFLVV